MQVHDLLKTSYDLLASIASFLCTNCWSACVLLFLHVLPSCPLTLKSYKPKTCLKNGNTSIKCQVVICTWLWFVIHYRSLVNDSSEAERILQRQKIMHILSYRQWIFEQTLHCLPGELKSLMTWIMGQSGRCEKKSPFCCLILQHMFHGL